MTLSRSVRALVDEAIGAGIFPSAALLVGAGDAIAFEYYAGAVHAGAPPDADTVYDLASLTKPLATVAILLRLSERGLVTVHAPVSAVLPDFASGDARRAAVTIASLLSHSSGLPAHRRYFEVVEAEQRASGQKLVGTRAGAMRIQDLAQREPLEREPEKQAVYSDVGFIILGRIVELVTGRTLDRVFREEIAAPLGLESTGYVDLEAEPPAFVARAAPCGPCAWRGKHVRGEVQDENAWAMGGVAGHSGLFSTAREVHRTVAQHVRAWRGEESLFARELVPSFWTRDRVTPASTWALGWDTPSPRESSAGRFVSPTSVGHLGFTGTSMWIDLERGLHAIFLTNRLELERDNTRMRAFRPRLHDAIFGGI